ncbi:unnamed protein product, partial [Allacma fusca]
RVCDGWTDCPSGDDELNCPCSSPDLMCQALNNTCVRHELHCNCFNDCPDVSPFNLYYQVYKPNTAFTPTYKACPVAP